jgi:NADH:ubiquinone oxidoreductase subunit 5 (subunit L)/multisubunit Na+/H+ antiporter MnhA subunit
MKSLLYRVLIVISVVSASGFLVATYSGILDGLRNSPTDKIMTWYPHLGKFWLLMNPHIATLQILCISYISVVILVPVVRYLFSKKDLFFQFASFLWFHLRKLLLLIWNN